jgi:peptide deformylase
MAKLEVITYGHPVLRQKAEEVKEITNEIKKIVKDMEETLAEQNGVGLAANQVGIPKKILLVDLTKSNGDRKIALINPRIISCSEEECDFEEGCLSVPGVWGIVTRPRQIKLKGTLLSGQTFVIDADDHFARVLQHEMDHLNGKLFIDYLLPEDKEKHRDLIDELLERNRKMFGKECL